VAVKARVPVLVAGSTDRTVHGANVPWVFSMLAGDDRLAPLLADELVSRVNDRPLALVSTDDHDARLFAAELAKALSQRAVAPHSRIECRRGAADAAEVVRRVLAAEPAAVALLADAHDSARLLCSLREAGYRGLVFGGPAMGRGRFLREAGEAAEGAIFARLDDPRLKAPDFAKAFRSRCGRKPDYLAAASYDSVRLMIGAIREAGLNRPRIRDAIAEVSPWQGAGGTVD
jgi:branched-chain amino acid transport system substrate-binding protein